MKWWEKTVEYFFAREFLGDSVFAPLDGNEERVGDLVFGEHGFLVLIEFKKDKGCVESEFKKFIDFDAANEKLGDYDDHHFLIYGTDKPTFHLMAETYFSAKEVDVKQAIKQGILHADFIKYLKIFLKYRKNSKSRGEGGGGIDHQYGLVALVNGSGEAVSCMSLNEYIEKHPHLSIEKTQDASRQPQQDMNM